MIHTFDDITFSLIKSERKTISIYVEPDGSIIVRAPKNIALEKVNNILDLKRFWIYESLAEFQELSQTKVKRKVTNGEGFLYMGKSYRLKIDKNLQKPLSLTQGYFLIDEKQIHKVKEHFINFYKEKGNKHIPQRVEYFKKKIGVEPKNIVIRELKNRWASRSRTALNFHWKVMLAPMSIIDYIIVHELAHFIKKDHSNEFWEIVESVMPNYVEKKNWLRTNGANLDI